jgi:hypothetical protein
MRRLAGAVCALLLAACGSSEQASAPALAPVAAATSGPADTAPAGMARYDGYGDLRFGMDEKAFADAWKGELTRLGPPGQACFYQTPKWAKTPSNFAFMFESGRFVRYDVGTLKETAPGGGKIGMHAEQIRTLYGARASETPHKYLPGGRVLRVTAPQGMGVLVFETDAQGRVTRWRAGVPPQVDYVEGCG